MPEAGREPTPFADRITADARDGWPVQAGRYRLVISRACPAAGRIAITRRLLGLERSLSQGVVDPKQERLDGTDQWAFTAVAGSPDDVDPVLGIHLIRDAYRARRAQYPGGERLPIVVEVATGRLVTDDADALGFDLMTEWRALHRQGAPDLYPVRWRDRIDELDRLVDDELDGAVQRAGFAQEQSVYEREVERVFACLDTLEAQLTGQRFLLGDEITEADIRMFVVLVRFDTAYHGLFKCNRRKLIQYPALWAYSRDLFQTPGFGDTVDFHHIRTHYYWSHATLNPSRIVAVGPDSREWLEPHRRADLGGHPFGAGTPPPPPRAEDMVPHHLG